MINLNTKLNSSQKGEVTELKCKTFLIEQGWNVSTPCGNYLKYDLVIEKNGKFHTIQCKKSHPIEGGFFVRTVHDQRVGTSTIKVPYTKADCDYFMTECDGKFYMFPVDEMKKITFRTSSVTKKTQRLASDYSADIYLQLIEMLS